MSIGLLVVLFFATIPFLFEYEALGSEGAPRVGVIEVLSLSRFRRQRWALGFAVLLALLGALTLAPSASGRSHTASVATVSVAVAAQVALWAYAHWRVRRKRRIARERSNGAT